MKIAVDAGHGGSDPGACGPSGLKESLVVLDVCKSLDTLFEESGIQTRLTRKAEVFVTLSDRASIANDWGADFFVSIHCNSNGESAVGIETLYKSDAGKRLAAAVQQAMLQATGDRDRGLKYRSDLYVLNATVMPAILAEIGFISHRATEEKLATTDYRWTIAEAVFEGIVQHLGWNTDSSRK